MPYTRGDRKTTEAELATTARVMRTVQKQIESYALSLDKIRGLREELAIDSELYARVTKSTGAMKEFLVSRGIPSPIATGMAAEDFRSIEAPGEALWTWDCCCTGCCITCIVNTIVKEEPIRRPE